MPKAETAIRTSNTCITGTRVKVNNDVYLKQLLSSKRNMLADLKMDNMLWVREFNVKKEQLEKDIDSLTKQVED